MTGERLTPWWVAEGLGKYAMTNELIALRARVAKLEAALTAAQQLIRDLGSPQAADRLGSEFGLKDTPK